MSVTQKSKLTFDGPSASQLIAEIRTGHLSPKEVMSDTIARIEEVEPVINAFTATRFEFALRRATAIQDEATKRGEWPLLCGLPIGVKDNADIAGLSTSGGSRLATRPVATESDPSIAALERNGAIGIGKTNLSELGGANTTNHLFGATVNPHNPDLTAGGSSGGTAAALAAGEIHLGHGNDVAGSLRTPAAFCGITGLRPTPGLVARRRQCDPFDMVFVEGPMARTLPDLALTLDAMVTDQHADILCQTGHAQQGTYLSAATSPLRPERVAFSVDLGALSVDPGVRASFQTGMTALSRAGLDLSEATPDLTALVPCAATLRGASYAGTWHGQIEGNRNSFTPDVRGDIERGLTQSGADVALAMRTRADVYHRACEFFDSYSLMICPTVQVAAFPHTTAWPKSIAGETCHSYIDWIMVTYLWSLLGYPTLAVPVGLDDERMPVSLQLVGPPHSEVRLLQAAVWITEALA